MSRITVVAAIMAAALALGASSATSRAGTRGGLRGPSRDWAYGVVIQPDGKIVAVGRTIDSRGRWRFGLMRFTPSGSVDVRFGRNGGVATAFGTKGASWAAAVALERDGKLVAADAARVGFAVGRYTARGRLDRTFGRGGKVTTAFRSEAKGVAVQPDSKLVVVGWSGLARYTARGRLDRSFGRGGNVAPGASYASAVVLQAGGMICHRRRHGGPVRGDALYAGREARSALWAGWDGRDGHRRSKLGERARDSARREAGRRR